MSHVPHELHEEFPELADKIHALKTGDAHFARLYDAYHEQNRAVHRAESDLEPTDDFHMQELRKERLRLKDELYAIMTR